MGGEEAGELTALQISITMNMKKRERSTNKSRESGAVVLAGGCIRSEEEKRVGGKRKRRSTIQKKSYGGEVSAIFWADRIVWPRGKRKVLHALRRKKR